LRNQFSTLRGRAANRDGRVRDDGDAPCWRWSSDIGAPRSSRRAPRALLRPNGGSRHRAPFPRSTRDAARSAPHAGKVSIAANCAGMPLRGPARLVGHRSTQRTEQTALRHSNNPCTTRHASVASVGIADRCQQQIPERPPSDGRISRRCEQLRGKSGQPGQSSRTNEWAFRSFWCEGQSRRAGTKSQTELAFLHRSNPHGLGETHLLDVSLLSSARTSAARLGPISCGRSRWVGLGPRVRLDRSSPAPVAPGQIPSATRPHGTRH
jgi:hypothetical protein